MASLLKVFIFIVLAVFSGQLQAGYYIVTPTPPPVVMYNFIPADCGSCAVWISDEDLRDRAYSYYPPSYSYDVSTPSYVDEQDINDFDQDMRTEDDSESELEIN